TDSLYRYYRYCVDEWAHWHHDRFQAANALLVEANEIFKSMHAKADDLYVMDKCEIAHANVLLDALVQGLETAKTGRVFAASEPFLIVWVSDSNHAIMSKSVRQLNSPAVATEFLSEFE